MSLQRRIPNLQQTTIQISLYKDADIFLEIDLREAVVFPPFADYVSDVGGEAGMYGLEYSCSFGEVFPTAVVDELFHVAVLGSLFGVVVGIVQSEEQNRLTQLSWEVHNSD